MTVFPTVVLTVRVRTVVSVEAPLTADPRV
jgi:hypothetical protein